MLNEAIFDSRMRQFLKNRLQHLLSSSNSTFLRQALLRLLYARKGMRFGGWKIFNNRFFILKVDGVYLPSQSPNWNITAGQFRINCKKISLHSVDLTKGDVVIDLGAGLGEEAVVYAALVGDAGKLYCMEPFGPAYEVLEQVVSLNGLKQVRLFPYALYHSNSKITLAEEQDSYNGVHVADNTGGATVQGIRFDTLMHQITEPRIRFMKVNIEGAEQYLLDASFVPIFRRIQHMAIACHDFRYHHERNPFFRTKENVCRFFRDQGFKVQWQDTGRAYLDDWVYISNPQF